MKGGEAGSKGRLNVLIYYALVFISLLHSVELTRIENIDNTDFLCARGMMF